MIPFNKPTRTSFELDHIENAIRSNRLCGNGKYTKICEDWINTTFGSQLALLTPSCTHALEMAALLLDIGEGDEVIMPSFTFVSTANAFVLRGARIVFIDIEPSSMNIDVTLIEEAITEKTKVIVPVHYAGVACEMDTIMDVANRHGIAVVEDAAQAMLSTYKGRKLGSFGDISAVSFHETKNFTAGGEGGCILVNKSELISRAEIIREKGTDRSQFLEGLVDKYSWRDLGSSYLPAEIQAAYLWPQLEHAMEITNSRLRAWTYYKEGFSQLEASGRVETPKIEIEGEHNGHIFHIKAKDIDERRELIKHLANDGVSAVFHYTPLHTSSAGMRFGRFHGTDKFTTRESERLLRLPIWYGIKEEQQSHVIKSVHRFYK